MDVGLSDKQCNNWCNWRVACDSINQYINTSVACITLRPSCTASSKNKFFLFYYLGNTLHLYAQITQSERNGLLTVPDHRFPQLQRGKVSFFFIESV